MDILAGQMPWKRRSFALNVDLSFQIKIASITTVSISFPLNNSALEENEAVISNPYARVGTSAIFAIKSSGNMGIKNMNVVSQKSKTIYATTAVEHTMKTNRVLFNQFCLKV